MTNADAAAMAVLVLTPVVLGGRAFVRHARGDRFTTSEATTAVGMIAVGTTIIGLTRSGLFAIALPVGMAAFGLALLAATRPTRTVGLMASIGWGAAILGALTATIAMLRWAAGI